MPSGFGASTFAVGRTAASLSPSAVAPSDGEILGSDHRYHPRRRQVFGGAVQGDQLTEDAQHGSREIPARRVDRHRIYLVRLAGDRYPGPGRCSARDREQFRQLFAARIQLDDRSDPWVWSAIAEPELEARDLSEIIDDTGHRSRRQGQRLFFPRRSVGRRARIARIYFQSCVRVSGKQGNFHPVRRYLFLDIDCRCRVCARNQLLLPIIFYLVKAKSISRRYHEGSVVYVLLFRLQQQQVVDRKIGIDRGQLVADHLRLRIELGHEICRQSVLLHRQAAGRSVRDGLRCPQGTRRHQRADRLAQRFRAQPVIDQLANRRVEQAEFIAVFAAVLDAARGAVRRLKIDARQQQRQQNFQWKGGVQRSDRLDRNRCLDTAHEFLGVEKRNIELRAAAPAKRRSKYVGYLAGASDNRQGGN